jgi:hypothetical protein
VRVPPARYANAKTEAESMVEPRPPAPTAKFVDEYCQLYQKLFPEVRSFEAFKYLHVGMISDIKRKTLPAITLSSRFRKSSTIASFFNRISLGC